MSRDPRHTRAANWGKRQVTLHLVMFFQAAEDAYGTGSWITARYPTSTECRIGRRRRNGSVFATSRPGFVLDERQPALLFARICRVGRLVGVTASADGGGASEPYYRRDLALVHDRGFGFHAQQCAPGVLAFLEPVRQRGGLVLEFGCGSGQLTRRLVDAGHDVVATDASPAMVELTRDFIGDRAREIRRLTLPEDPMPAADAIVGIGHPLNYLPDAGAIEQALTAIAAALKPGGLLAFDICDLEWGRRGVSNLGRVGTDWAIITEFSVPSPDRFVREMTTFVANRDGTWRRDGERHENVLIDTATVRSLLSELGVDAQIHSSFGSETHPPGLHVVLGRRAR